MPRYALKIVTTFESYDDPVARNKVLELQEQVLKVLRSLKPNEIQTSLGQVGTDHKIFRVVE